MEPKQTVRGPVQPETEKAQEIKATRASDAEILAVMRHQRINMVWERTQAYMAIMVVTVVMIVCAYIALSSKYPKEMRLAALVFLTNNAALVAGFYFGRTNHTRPTGESK